MSRKFKQLSQGRRYQIQALVATNKTGKEIQEKLGLSDKRIHLTALWFSTISRFFNFR